MSVETQYDPSTNQSPNTEVSEFTQQLLWLRMLARQVGYATRFFESSSRCADEEGERMAMQKLVGAATPP
jgi:hypothetical protein